MLLVFQIIHPLYAILSVYERVRTKYVVMYNSQEEGSL